MRRKIILNSDESISNIVYQISKDSVQKHGEHPMIDLKMENVYFRKQIGFVPSNLLWKTLKREMAKDS